MFRYAAMVVIGVILGALAVWLLAVLPRDAELARLDRERERLTADVGALIDRNGTLQKELDAARKGSAAAPAEAEVASTATAPAPSAAAPAAPAPVPAAEKTPAIAAPGAQQNAAIAELRQALETAQRERAVLEKRLAAAATPAQQPPAAPSQTGNARGMYTVQAGDSLSKIAAFFYRDAQRWPDIQKANAALAAGPDRLEPGMVLVIPR